MDNMVELINREAPKTLQPALAGLTRYSYLRQANAKPAAYVDVFVGNLPRLAKGPFHRRQQVQRTLIHALEKVFWTCDSGDLTNRKEVLPLKNLLTGDSTWTTCQVLLGWVIDTVNMRLSLYPHQGNRFKDIPEEVSSRHKRINVEKWQWVLGELRSMYIALPGARGLFSHMQEALRHVEEKW